jgi:hypothetical protein
MHILALAVKRFPETPEMLIEMHAEKKGFVRVFKKPCLLKSLR